MASYIYPASALFINTNPLLKTLEELNLENFITDISLGKNDMQLIRTDFTITDEITTRLPRNLIEESQARLLITRQYGLGFDIASVSINDFSNLTDKQRRLIINYLRTYQ
jgi:hypothetical protein